MGGEMLYILHQRLRAQKVDSSKEAKVLQEVICAMFDSAFVTGLFQPQDMYTSASTRQIFDRLAHSSLMRLNKTSMDKLYDLMTMSFKHQILNCSNPREFLHMTLTHLQSLKNIANGNARTTNLLENTEAKVVAMFGRGGPCSGVGPMLLLKQALYQYVQDKKIRASLFLQHDIQGKDGMFILSLKGPLPFGTSIPGTVKTYERGSVRHTYKLNIEIKSANQTLETSGPWNPLFNMGTNLYTMNSSAMCLENSESDKPGREKVLQKLELIEAGGGGTVGSVHSPTKGNSSLETSGSVSAYIASGKNISPGKSMNSAAAKAERSLNESLLGRSADSKDFSRGPVNLASLIPTVHDSSSGGSGGVVDLDMDMLEFDAAADAKTMDSMMRHLDLHHDDAKSGTRTAEPGAKGISSIADSKDDEESDDDLLALMDGLDEK
jgi:hypothetical protein